MTNPASLSGDQFAADQASGDPRAPAEGWNWVLVELRKRGDARAAIGPGDLAREAARAAVQKYLD